MKRRLSSLFRIISADCQTTFPKFLVVSRNNNVFYEIEMPNLYKIKSDCNFTRNPLGIMFITT